MNRRIGVLILLFVVALGIGVQIAIADLSNEDVQAAVLKILILTFVLGVAAPRFAWAWALIVGLCIPAVEFVAAAKGVHTAVPLNPPTSFLALLPAFIGAYAGLFVRRLSGRNPHVPTAG